MEGKAVSAVRFFRQPGGQSNSCHDRGKARSFMEDNYINALGNDVERDRAPRGTSPAETRDSRFTKAAQCSILFGYVDTTRRLAPDDHQYGDQQADRN